VVEDEDRLDDEEDEDGRAPRKTDEKQLACPTRHAKEIALEIRRAMVQKHEILETNASATSRWLVLM
jgi:hypothetical protein